MASEPQVCIWREAEMGECWETDCGRSFVLNDGQPSENDFRFCTYCGRRLEEELLPEKEDDLDWLFNGE